MVPDADFVLPIEVEGTMHNVYVRKRPYVDEFLYAMGQIYEVVLFTASLSKYADPVTDRLDTFGVVSQRLFREHCVYFRGVFVKDLTRLGRKLEHTAIIDNSPFSYLFQPDNAIAVDSWFDDRNDTQLKDLIPLLQQVADLENIRDMQKLCQSSEGEEDSLGSELEASET